MTSRENFALAKCLQDLEVDNFHQIEDRIAFQKKIYLLQTLGVNLGYMFRWDKFGPYSRDLAINVGTYLKNKDSLNAALKNLTPKKFVREGIDKTKELTTVPEQLKQIRDVDFLEFLSSLHFIATSGKREKPLPTDSAQIDDIKNKIFAIKPHLGQYKEYFNEIWSHLTLFFPHNKTCVE